MKEILYVIVILIFLSPVSAATLELKPEKLFFPDVLRGGYTESPFLLQTDQGEFTISYKIDGEIKEWIQIESLSEFSKEDPLKGLVKIYPPEGASNGLYKGFIFIMVKDKNTLPIETYKEISLVLEVSVEMSDTIVKQILINGLEVHDGRVGENPELFLDVLNAGNVDTLLKIQFDITDSTQSIKNDSFEQLIKPAQRKNIQYIIPVALKEGEYTAHIKIFAENSLIREEYHSFFMLTQEEFLRKGYLKELRNEQRYHPGDKVVISGIFVNEGDISVSAYMKTDLFLGNNKIDSVEGERVFIRPQHEGIVETSVIPQEVNTYRVKSYVVYGDKISNTKENAFEVIPSHIPLQEIPLSGNPMLIILLLAFLVFLYVRIQRFRRKKWKTS